MIELALSFGVAVGAHPSFPDRQNFGRIEMKIHPEVLQQSLKEQIGLMANVAARFGLAVSHVKPHGALYHSASSDAAVTHAIVNAVRAVDPSMIVVAQYGSRAVERYQAAGLRTATEAFADHAYEPNGTLRSRTLPGALLDENRAVEQAKSIVLYGSIKPRTVPSYPSTRMPSAFIPTHRMQPPLRNAFE